MICLSVDLSVHCMNCMLIVIAYRSYTELLVVLSCMEAVDRLKHVMQKLSTGYSVLCESCQQDCSVFLCVNCRQVEACSAKPVDRLK